jgi:hypothetical protein
VWNRLKMIRDPSTGRRISRPNDPSEIRRVSAPHLRIISDETFQAAQKRKSERAHASPGTRKRGKTVAVWSPALRLLRRWDVGRKHRRTHAHCVYEDARVGNLREPPILLP